VLGNQIVDVVPLFRITTAGWHAGTRARSSSKLFINPPAVSAADLVIETTPSQVGISWLSKLVGGTLTTSIAEYLFRDDNKQGLEKWISYT
jgi:hypothetical protein